MQLPTNEEWARACAADGEFALAARHWTGGLTLVIGEAELSLRLTDGAVSPGSAESAGGLLTYAGPADVWERVLAAQPPRFHNDIMANLTVGGGLNRQVDPVVHAQYYPAVMRAVELLRPAETRFMPMRDEARPPPSGWP